jgi:hypothetical protein
MVEAGQRRVHLEEIGACVGREARATADGRGVGARLERRCRAGEYAGHRDREPPGAGRPGVESSVPPGSGVLFGEEMLGGRTKEKGRERKRGRKSLKSRLHVY